MDVFKVPVLKDANFKISLFQMLSNSIDELGFDNQKVPSSIKFTGKLGREIFETITELKWDLNNLNPIFVDSRVSQIIIGYTDKITKTESIGISSESIDGRIIEGIPSDNSMRSLISTSLNITFNKERTLDPHIIINLIR